MTLFLSYSTRDKHFVRRLAGDLERAGLRCWLDERELRAGDDLAAIGAAIRGATLLIVVVSLASAGSAWVEREIEVAESTGVRVLPVLLEDVPGRWADRVARLAPADFRRPQEYRRSTHRLIAAIEGRADRAGFLRAKEAVAKVRAERSPVGDLFGVSQQGVARLYCLTDLGDWEFADVTDGYGRFWIAEFYEPGNGRIVSYAVVDGTIHDLPETYRDGCDLVPVADSIVTYSCALNPMPGISADRAAALVAEHSAEMQHVGRRYVPFRPEPFSRPFVDSTVAVAAALDAAFGAARDPGDLFTLVRLECDKRNRLLPTWTVAFFDPTVSQSVHTVGVDAVTGTVSSARMRSEILNAAFMTTRVDPITGDYVINAANQFRAIDNRVWDRPASRAAPTGLSARDAVRMAEEYLRGEPDPRAWQLGFLSTTGVTSTAAAPAGSGVERLMRHDGTAGQWVVEVFGVAPADVRDGERVGYSYPFRSLLCTRDRGVVPANPRDTLILTSPLSDVPLPDDLFDAFERARTLAIACTGTDFVVMSVALRRSRPAAHWRFRCYDDADIIAEVTVSGDGHRLMDLSRP
jgi:hypothetical protein